jgi:hypothetical protein
VTQNTIRFPLLIIFPSPSQQPPAEIESRPAPPRGSLLGGQRASLRERPGDDRHASLRADQRPECLPSRPPASGRRASLRASGPVTIGTPPLRPPTRALPQRRFVLQFCPCAAL